jgi:chemotaxis-related protein WspB
MLLLLVQAGSDRYALTCRQVVEIVPKVPLLPMSHLASPVVGGLNYRERLIPVVDLRLAVHHTPCRMQVSTRIVLFDLPNQGLAGLMAERVTEAKSREQLKEVLSPGSTNQRAGWTDLFLDAQGTIQGLDGIVFLQSFQL